MSSDDEHKDDRPYAVGYQRPPVAHRFRSGNRAAANRRRRPEPAQDILNRLMLEKVTATRRGRPVEIPAFEALIRGIRHQALALALAGDMRAVDQLI